MRVNSLSFRLTASAAAVSIVLLVVAGLLLINLFSSAVERNFDARLQAVLDGLLANVEVAENQQLNIQGQIADTRFRLPLSGWYWQVTPVEEKSQAGLASPSLLEARLKPAPGDLAERDASDIARFFLTDSNNTRLRVIEQRFTLFGGEQHYSFIVAGNFDELKQEIAAFTGTLIIVLGLLGVGLLAALMVQVRYGLKPLRLLRRELSEIRRGNSEQLAGEFPVEIKPVADELNLLIHSNTEIIERARTQVGNLAHALKTPLSVLANEARLSKGKLSSKVDEQTEIMRTQVELYLDRARRAARARSIGVATKVREACDGLARTLMRINMDRGLQIEVNCPEELKFRGEKQDFEEMLGNLMENASKWADREIVVTGALLEEDNGDDRKWVVISVGDDGPGLPEETRHEALIRGRRLDETKPGTGLGLSIVSETAAMYDGTIELGASELGGLLVTLKLPSV
ncbi:Sensor histidine kinase [hydrothermal vent metagenome]|uniref:histidine kinase n=1 Tax=hydrothermal vent metagenome TaxID=652676 RepID=A0A3B0RRA6_9ZZZZ